MQNTQALVHLYLIYLYNVHFIIIHVNSSTLSEQALFASDKVWMLYWVAPASVITAVPQELGQLHWISKSIFKAVASADLTYDIDII